MFSLELFKTFRIGVYDRYVNLIKTDTYECK